MRTTWARLRLRMELAAWRRAGRAAVLWWRDDDARSTSPALTRLLALCARHGAPLTLAVIPDAQPQHLAGAYDPSLVTVIQHGVDHVNRLTGARAGEFDPALPAEAVADAIARGWGALARLPGAYPVFAPPWNEAHPALEQALARLGFIGWSAFGTLEAGGEVRRLDTHLDLLRWKKGVRFRGEDRFVTGLTLALAARRRAGAWTSPIGLLTHHLDHDEAAWAYLDRFLAWSRTEPVLSWRALPELLGGGEALAAYARSTSAGSTTGMRTITVVPSPSRLSMTISPPCSSAKARTRERPRPVPMARCSVPPACS